MKTRTISAVLIVIALSLGVHTAVAFQGAAPAAKPYHEIKVTQAMIDKAIKSARQQNKFLMVDFGANWCEDCIVLAHNLESGESGTYFQKHFVVYKVDVGRFDKNLDIVKSLNVTLEKGIPTAVFFDPKGKRVGATDSGELESSRSYGTKQIYEFLKQIIERQTIVKPGF